MKAIVNGIDAQSGIQFSTRVDSPNALTAAVEEANATPGVVWVQIEQLADCDDDMAWAIEIAQLDQYDAQPAPAW
jgi:hypothetical protein